MHCSQVSSGAAAAQYKVQGNGHKASGCGEAKPAKAADGCGPRGGCHDGPKAERPEAAERPVSNPLVAAMMEAIKSLVPSASAAVPTQAAPAQAGPVAAPTQAAGAAPAAAAAASAPTAVANASTAEVATPAAAPVVKDSGKDAIALLKEAAYAFAHELFHALKAAGESSGAYAPKQGNGYGTIKGYGDMAQSLQRLAQSIAPPTANAAQGAVSARPPLTETTPYTPGQLDTAESAKAKLPAPPPDWMTSGAASAKAKLPAPPPPDWMTAGTDAAKAKLPAPPRDLMTSGAASAKAKLPAPPPPDWMTGGTDAAKAKLPAPPRDLMTSGAASAKTSAPASASSVAATESPLLAAFKKLMVALNPTAGASSPAAPAGSPAATSPEQMLQSFLQQIAKSLQGDTAAQTPAMPASGSLVNLTA